MKFLHVADAHLDSPFLGLSFLPDNEKEKIKRSTQVAFTKMVDYALANQVDFVLLVGDTFDSPNPTPSSQTFLMKQLDRLTSNQIPTYLSFGNHDYMTKQDLLVQENEYLHIFDQEVSTLNLTTKAGMQVAITGFSYEQNHILDDLTGQFPNVQTGVYNIGTLHGSLKTTIDTQNVYAPFTLAELVNKNYQYFALGHIHKREVLSENPLVVYSGNLQGRNINEATPKGFYEVNVSEDFQSTLNFVSTSEFVWQIVPLTFANEVTKSNLVAEIVEQINAQIEQTTLIEVAVQNSEVLSPEIVELMRDHDFLTGLNKELRYHSLVVRSSFRSQAKIVLSKTDQQFFDEATDSVFTNDAIAELTKNIQKKYPFAVDYLNSEDYLEKLKTQTGLNLKQRFEVED